MDRKKQKRLQDAGWRVGSAADFLGLSAAEEELVAMKLALSVRLKKTRERCGVTQTELAVGEQREAHKFEQPEATRR